MVSSIGWVSIRVFERSEAFYLGTEKLVDMDGREGTARSGRWKERWEMKYSRRFEGGGRKERQTISIKSLHNTKKVV